MLPPLSMGRRMVATAVTDEIGRERVWILFIANLINDQPGYRTNLNYPEGIAVAYPAMTTRIKSS